MEYGFMFDVAIILAATKLLGMLTRRVKLPQVVGALLAGLILGPAGFGILKETEFITQVAELGVIVLMFDAGLETDINELKRSGKNSFIVALMGVIIPFIGGFIVADLYGIGTTDVLKNVFIGVILTATSVSISVETLKEMGRLSTRSGNIILGAALIDDILGIILLTVITSFADPNVNIMMMAIKIIAFFALSGILGMLLHKGFAIWMKRHDRDLRRFAVFSFAFCLLYSFVAEEFFGVADITGAFFAGLVISNTAEGDLCVIPCQYIVLYAIKSIVFCEHRFEGRITGNELGDHFLYADSGNRSYFDQSTWLWTGRQDVRMSDSSGNADRCRYDLTW